MRAVPARHLRAWLHRILTTTFISGYRKRRREPRQVATDEIAQRHLARYESRLRAGQRAAEVEVLERCPDSQIRRAFQALHEDFRVAVYLADIEGYANTEIARITGTSAGTMSSQLYRGRQRLRDLLREYAAGRGFAESGPPVDGVFARLLRTTPEASPLARNIHPRVEGRTR